MNRLLNATLEILELALFLFNVLVWYSVLYEKVLQILFAVFLTVYSIFTIIYFKYVILIQTEIERTLKESE